MSKRSSIFQHLMIAICLFLIGYPLLVDEGLFGRTIEAVFGLGILATGIRVVPEHKKRQKIVIPILWILIGSWFAELVYSDQMIFTLIRQGLLMFFFIRFMVLVGKDVFVTRRVDATSRLYGAVCVYLLMAAGFANLFLMIEEIIPHSFGCSTELCPHGETVFRSGTHLYYSLITLATVGYGDITPIQPLAAMIAALEAIVGQMYVGIVIARLVGLHLMETTETAPIEKPEGASARSENG
ncbi:MAG: hypothetical protein RLZ25_2025 [Pseudomonadota bacterium]|jgi:hypothetical protein